MKFSVNFPPWLVQELDEHVETFLDYDSRTHLLYVILGEWLNDHRAELHEAQEEESE